MYIVFFLFFFSSRRRHTRWNCDWSSDVCSSDLARAEALDQADDIRGLIGAAWVLVTNSDGILIARTDYREQYDRDLSIAPLVANALSGDQTSGAWLDDVRGTMYLAVGTPLRDRPTAAPLGAL